MVKAFAKQGGIAAANPAEVGANASIVIVLVVNAEQTEEVLFGRNGAAPRMARGSVVVASATVPPAYAEYLGQRLAPARNPLDRRPGQRRRRARGERAAVDHGLRLEGSRSGRRSRCSMPSRSRCTAWASTPGMGSKVKMINQLLAGVHIASACEAMALGIRAGVDPNVLYEVISNSAGASWMFQNRVPHILAGDYTPLSAVNIFVKDLGIVLDSAKKLTFPLPITATAHQMYLMAGAAGHGMEDDSAVVKVFQHLSGISLPAKRIRARPSATRRRTLPVKKKVKRK